MNKFLNKHEPIYETAGNLPHWTQYGKITFVTFRLVDSLPQYVIDNIKTEYESIKQRLLKEGCQKELELLKAKRHTEISSYKLLNTITISCMNCIAMSLCQTIFTYL